MKKKILVALVVLMGLSVIAQAIYRFQLRRAFDICNISGIYEKEQFHRDFGSSVSLVTHDRIVDKIGAWILPLGPLFHYRNNQTIRAVYDINERHLTKEKSDETTRKAALEIYSLVKFPL